MLKLKHFFIPLLLLSAYYFIYSIYPYYFDKKQPSIDLNGLIENAYYQKNIDCNLIINDSYKLNNFTVYCDDQILLSNPKVNKKKINQLLTINSETLSDGPHKLKIITENAKKEKKSTTLEKQFFSENITPKIQVALLNPLNNLEKFFQGKTLHLKFKTNRPVKNICLNCSLGENYQCIKDNIIQNCFEVFIPIKSTQAPGEYFFNVKATDNFNEQALTGEHKFYIEKYPFKKKTVTVNNEKLKTETEFTTLTDKDFESKIAELLEHSPEKKLFEGAFVIPLEMTGISTEFGVIRSSNTRGLYAHNAVDLLALPKAVVWAAQDGIIVLKDRFLHSGNTIVIDHGYKIFSFYFHLNSFATVEVGQIIKKGNPIGIMGMTGYANGPHLHWELRCNNIAVDPLEWTKPEFFN